LLRNINLLPPVSFHVEPALISSIALMFGLFYAFLANYIWGANQAAKLAVVQEAEGVRNILRYSAALSPNEAESLRAVLAAYVHNVLDNDWPAMQEARLNPASSEKLNDVARAIFPVLSANDSRQAISQKLLEAFQQINSGWQTRTRIAVLRHGQVAGSYSVRLTHPDRNRNCSHQATLRNGRCSGHFWPSICANDSDPVHQRVSVLGTGTSFIRTNQRRSSCSSGSGPTDTEVPMMGI
jgi:hypothetical protein